MPQTEISASVDAVDVKNIKAIELADGWHNIKDCRLVHFAVGEAHSPITPHKLYPTLRYKNASGMTVRTPLGKILSFSEQVQVDTDEMSPASVTSGSRT